jgi:hypothetical protein
MRPVRPVLVLLLAAASLAGCGSVHGEIRDLDAEEREISTQLAEMQERRKSIIALMTALEHYDRLQDARNEAAVAKARARYEASR